MPIIIPITSNIVINNPYTVSNIEVVLNPYPEFKLQILDEDLNPIVLPLKQYDTQGNVVGIIPVTEIHSDEFGQIDFNMTMYKGTYYLKVIDEGLYQTLQLEQEINYAEIDIV